MADPQNPGPDQYGPFTSALTGPLNAQVQQPAINYAPSRAGAIALFASNFLQGLQAGQRQHYERSEQKKAEQFNSFNKLYADALQADTLSPAGKAAAQEVYHKATGPLIVDAANQGLKEQKDNPLLHLAKKIGTGMAGEGENKAHKDFSPFYMQLHQIMQDPKYKQDPAAIGNTNAPAPGQPSSLPAGANGRPTLMQGQQQPQDQDLAAKPRVGVGPPPRPAGYTPGGQPTLVPQQGGNPTILQRYGAAVPLPNLALPPGSSEAPAAAPQASPAATPAGASNIPPYLARNTTPPPIFMAPGPAEGLARPGNIDLTKQPVTDKRDGKSSTVYSTSFLDETPGSPTEGKEVLVPGLINGKRLDDLESPDKAKRDAATQILREKYKKDGLMLGAFDTPEQADAYGQRLHEDWAKIPGVQVDADWQKGAGTTPGSASTPVPGSPAAAAQAPKAKEDIYQRDHTFESAYADPDVRARIDAINSAGLDLEKTPFGRWLTGLQHETKEKTTPITGKTVATFGPDGKPTYHDAKRDATGRWVSTETGQPIPGAVEVTSGMAAETRATATPKPSTQAEKRQMLIDAYVQTGKTLPEATQIVDKQMTETAEAVTTTAQKKAEKPATKEDEIASWLLDGKFATDKADAKTQAAKMLVDYEQALIKAKKTTAAGGGNPFTPADLTALATIGLITHQDPAFGMGANNPARVAYLKAKANIITTGGVGNALNAQTDFKALSSSLNQMEKTESSVGSFEASARKALDNATEQSKKYPRTSSAYVNGWDQWLKKGFVDDKDLQQLFVYTETAANEYARVIGSITGTSTNAAREQANSFIRAQLAEGAFDGAADAMRTDMKNRMDAFHDKIGDLRGSIKDLASISGAPPRTAPPPASAAVASTKPIQLGGKTISVGDTYKPTGKKIIGFTKDGHIVTED